MKKEYKNIAEHNGEMLHESTSLLIKELFKVTGIDIDEVSKKDLVSLNYSTSVLMMLVQSSFNIARIAIHDGIKTSDEMDDIVSEQLKMYIYGHFIDFTNVFRHEEFLSIVAISNLSGRSSNFDLFDFCGGDQKIIDVYLESFNLLSKLSEGI